MDSTDDDFGDLYVDVDAQAASAVSGGAHSGRFPGDSECGTDLDRIESSETRTTPWSDAEAEAKKLGVATRESSRCIDDGGGVTQFEESNELEDSESDDDCNIVLTDGDNGNGGYDDVAPDGVEASDNNSVRRAETGNGCRRIKMEASGNNACVNGAQGKSQCGYSFLQPWCRTVFGSSMDLKPWRNPGANIADFFNFGFDEQSWEDYCKSLRHHYAFTDQHAMALDYDVTDKTQVEPLARSSDGRSRLLLKGRAIEVEDRTLERVPSVDLRRPRDPDPDVVIQITADTSVGELSGSTVEEPARLITEATGASGNEDDNKQMHYSVVSTQEQASMEFQEGSNRTSSDEQPPLEENWCSPEGAPCAKEVIDEDERDDSDPYPVERESSSDQIQFSPTPSYSVGMSEASEDFEAESQKESATDDQLEVSTPPRRNRSSEYKVHERNSIKAGERNETEHPSCRKSHDVGERNGTKRVRPSRSHEELRKRRSGRPDYAVGRVRDSPSVSEPDSDFGQEKLVRNTSPVCYSRRGDRDGKGFQVSDRERHYSRMYASMDSGRRGKREHKFHYQSNKQSLRPRGMEHSSSYNFETNIGDYTAHPSFNYPRRKSSWSFKEEENPYDQHYCRNDGDIRDRNRNDSRTEPFYMEREHRFSSGHASDNRRYNHRLHYRNRYDHGSILHRHRYGDEVHREKYGVPPLKLDYYERHTFGEPARREYPEYERDSCRGEAYKDPPPDWRIDGFASEKAGFNYRTEGVGPSRRETRYAKGARDEIWRDIAMEKSRKERLYTKERRHSNGKDTIRDEWRELGRKPERNQDPGEETRRNGKGEEEMGEERIRESLMKMKRRRERFKVSEGEEKKKVVAGGEEAKAGEVRDETNPPQQRPARKRRWSAAATTA